MKAGWLKLVLMALVLEKIIQHIFVTLAFYFNWDHMRSTVAVSPDALMVLGAAGSHPFYNCLLGAAEWCKMGSLAADGAGVVRYHR